MFQCGGRYWNAWQVRMERTLLPNQLPDGSFIHFSMSDGETSPIPKLDAHQRFTSNIKERLLEGPQQTDVTIVGNYRMVSE